MGRKPSERWSAIEDLAERRKAQNRAAQRKKRQQRAPHGRDDPAPSSSVCTTPLTEASLPLSQNTGRSLDDGPDDTSTVNNPQQDISALETFPNQPFVSSQFTQPTIAMSPDADTLYSQISDYPTRTFDTPSYHPEDYIATPDALSPPSSSVPLTSVSPSWVDPQPPRSRTALNQVHPRFSDTFTNSKSNLLSPASRQRSDLSHLTSQSTAAPSPTSAPSDSASLQSSQAPVEERVQQVLTAVRGSGFPSLENMVLHYYSSDFSHDPILSEMQHRSRRRELGTFLTALTRDAETWSPREAERYEETVTGRAEHIVHREIHRFLEQDRMPGTQDMARLREELPNTWSMLFEISKAFVGSDHDGAEFVRTVLSGLVPD